MGNAAKGVVSFEAGDDLWNLTFDFNAMCEIEDEFDMPVSEMRILTTAGPSGVAVRHSYQYRLSINNEAYQSAGWHVDLSSAGVPTVVFDFARFVITDSSNRRAAPFRFENGTLFVEGAVAARFLVGQLVADQIEARSIDAQKLTIGGVSTGNLGIGAVTGVLTFGGGVGAAGGTDDARLSDPRAPTAHSHPQSEVQGLADALAAKAESSQLGSISSRNLTVSTANPSGGVNGDIWFKV